MGGGNSALILLATCQIESGPSPPSFYRSEGITDAVAIPVAANGSLVASCRY